MAKGHKNGGELYTTPGGIVHASASLSDLPRGKYIERIGAPGDPLQKSSELSSKFPGKQGPGKIYLQKGKK